MASQTGQNIKSAFKIQSGLGTLASGAGATGIDLRPSQGLKLNVTPARSKLIRRDGMSVKPRQGSRNVTGQYETELIVDALDDIFQAVTRGTWVASADITNATASLGSATISGTGTIVTAGGGSWITAGLRNGMMCRFTSMSTAANNGKWFPVYNVAALTFNVPTGILTDQALDASFTLTLARQVIQGDPPTERYYTIEQYLQDLDQSIVAQDCKFNGLTLQVSPDEPAVIGFDVIGRDLDIFATGSSPTFTSPTFATANPLYLADGAMYVNGTAVVNITGLRMGLTMNGGTQPVAGSRLSPDVYLGNSVLEGEFMGTVEDDTWLNYSQAETQLSMILRFSERETDPADFVSFYFGNLSGLDFGVPIGSDRGLIQTIPLVGGKDEGGATSGYAPTMVMISTSAT